MHCCIDIGSILKRLAMEKKLESKKSIINVNSNWGRGISPHIAKVIFSKLPIFNLPVCRLVCKTWNHLVLDYANSSSKFLNLNAFLLATSDSVPNSSPPSGLCNPKMHCIHIDTKHLEWMSSVASFGFEGHWSNISIVNSCNGLLLVSKFNYDTCCLGILNPMTTKFFKLPGSELEDDIYCYVFGFSPKTHQYKLFRVTSDQTESSCIMEVFRFGRSRGGTNQNHNHNHNQWRHLHCLPFDTNDCGVYLNGAIYWIGKEKQRENEYAIYALDVETEKIELVAVLEVGPYSRRVFFQPFKGSIYATFFIYPAFFMSPAPCEIQVWMMREKDSWTREFVIHDIPNDWVLQHRASISFLLIKAFEDGEILCLVNGDFFCLYNPKTGMKKIKTLNQNERQIRPECHIESLNFGSLPNILAGDD